MFCIFKLKFKPIDWPIFFPLSPIDCLIDLESLYCGKISRTPNRPYPVELCTDCLSQVGQTEDLILRLKTVQMLPTVHLLACCQGRLGAIAAELLTAVVVFSCGCALGAGGSSCPKTNLFPVMKFQFSYKSTDTHPLLMFLEFNFPT